MNALLHASVTDLWSLAGWTMVHFLWLGAIVAGGTAVARFALRSVSSNIRYAIAIGSLTALAALPPTTAFWLLKNLPPTQVFTAESPAAAAQISTPTASASGPGSGGLTSAAQPTATSALPLQSNPRQSRGLPAVTAPAPTIASPATFADLLESCVNYLPWLWLIGTPLTFALLVSGVVGTRRLGRSSHAIDSDPIVELLAHLAASLRITRRVTVAVCDRIASPVLIGIVRPMILLPPAALTGWSPDELEMVLLHELAHVRRWDNFVNLLQRCVESLLFFHPAVWLISNWARREREACCDATVVARTNRPHAYAELLVALAAQLPRSVLFHPAASSAMSAGPLRSRIRQILKLEEDPMLVSGKSLVVGFAVVFAITTTLILYLPTMGRAEPSATEHSEKEPGKTTTDRRSKPESDSTAEYPYQVKFEKGASKFLDGDEITIDEIRGTAKEFEPGNKYQIKGKYKLHSHPSASLSAYTTAKESKDGYGPTQSVQTQTVSHGEGDFTLILPMTVRGWPHVSFYGTGEDFGGIYFGTGDCVLKEWWGSKKSTRDKSDSGITISADKLEFENGQIRASGQVMVDQKAASNGEVAKASAKFPSLQDQKLADLAYKRLGLELEPINEVDLNRIKALGYDGGVEVASGSAGLGGLEDSMIRPGDVLVGLGIWPTNNMKAVGEILTRPETADLNPVKFYVVRGETLPPSTEAIPQQRDIVHTGRVEIRDAGSPEAGYSTATPTLAVAGLAPRYPGALPVAIVNQFPAQALQTQTAQANADANPYAAPSTAVVPWPRANNIAEASKRLEEALNRKTQAMEKRTAAKTDEEVEKTKRDLDAANKQLEEAKRQLEETKRQKEKANGWPVGPANATTLPSAGWQTAGRAGDNAAGSQSTSATPEELEILRDRVKSTDEQLKLIHERLKSGKGATEFDVQHVGIDLATAESDLALAEGHRDEAIKKLEDARKQAEETVQVRKAASRAGIDSPDLEEVMKATRTLSDIKLKLIRLQKEVIHPGSSDDRPRSAAVPDGTNPFAEKPGGKSSVNQPLPAGPAAEPEPVLRTPFVGEAETTQKHDSSALTAPQPHPSDVPIPQTNPKDTPAPDTHPHPSVDAHHNDNSPDGRSSRSTRTDTNRPRSSRQAATNANEAQSDDRIVVAYDIPAELVDDVKRTRDFPTGIHGEFGSGGRYFLQATPERQKQFQQLLDATPKWRDPEAAQARAKQVYVKTEKDGQEYLEWQPAGLTFTSASNPKFDRVNPNNWHGVIVADVAPGSPGNWNGIEPGDIMTKLSSFETKSLSELESLLKTQGSDYSTKKVSCMIFRFSPRGDSGQLPGSLNLAPDRTKQKPSAPTDDIAAEQPQTTIADHAKPPSSVETTDKSALRYDGKTFDEWREMLTNELSTEKRIEAVKALAAFGRAGYAKEASQAILNIAGEYDFYTMQGDVNPEEKLKDVVQNELAPDSRTQPMVKYSIPDVVGRLTNDPQKWKWLAIRLLENLKIDDTTTISAVEQLTKNADSDLRSIALRALVTADHLRESGKLDDKTQQLLTTALESKNPAEVTAALNSIVYKSPDGTSVSAFNPALATLVFDKNSGLQLAARNVLKYLPKEDAAKLVDKYAAVLEDESRKTDHVAAIRALGVLGTAAEIAVPQLEKIFADEKQDLPSLVAAAFAIDQIEGGVRCQNLLLNVENSTTDEKMKTRISKLTNEERQLHNR